MKVGKELAILFFITTVLLFYIYNRTDERTHYQLPEITEIRTDDVSQVVIRKPGEETHIVRKDDAWFVGAREYPADSRKISNLLKKIAGLKVSALASESGNLTVYDLDERNRITVEAYQGETLMRRIIIGKPASSFRHTFILLDDDQRVFHAEGNFRSDFDMDVSGFRDRSVLKLQEEIVEVVLTNETGEMRVMKAPDPLTADGSGEISGQENQGATSGWYTSDHRRVRGEEIEELIRTLSDFQCDDFIEDRKREDFLSPVFTVSLRGEKTSGISLFQKEEGQYPAISTESEYPFLISEWKADRIMKDFAGLVE